MSRPSIHATLPAGLYYIGDLAYILKDYVYHEWKDYSSGCFSTSDGYICVDGTIFPDVAYKDSDAVFYKVRKTPTGKGTLGIASLNLVDTMKLDTKMAGKVVHFKDRIEFSSYGGLITIRDPNEFSLEIDTRTEQDICDYGMEPVNTAENVVSLDRLAIR